MSPFEPLAILLGAALFFFLPGFAVARAVFPEKRFRGAAGLRGALELVVLSFVLSVALTVLVGYLLLSVAPGAFSATWDTPTLEVALAALAAVGFGVGAARGAYSATPPAGRAPAALAGDEGAWQLSRKLDRLAAERRAARRERTGAAEAGTARLARIDDEEGALARAREAEYDR